MESQFLEAKETYLKNYKAANVDRPLPPEKFLEEQILENLIIQELQIQRAFKAGVRISDQELNESMSLLAANNNLSLVIVILAFVNFLTLFELIILRCSFTTFST